MEKVGVDTERRLAALVARDRNLVLLGIFDQLRARAEIPFPPGRDHPDVGLQRVIGKFETHLVVALAGGTMRHRVGADGARDLDLALGDQRARDRGAEEIDAFIERVRAEHREDIVAHEFLAQILDEDLADPQHFGLGACRLDFLALADIGGEGDDLRVVAVLQPAQDDRGVEPAGIGQHDFFDVFMFHGVPHNGSSCGPQRSFSWPRGPAQ